MARPLTKAEREAFLAEPRIGVLSLASDDERSPLAFPTWFGYQPGGEITYYTHTAEPKPRKLRLLHEGAVVSLCVQREERPYKYVTVEGTVVAEDVAPAFEQRFAIVRRYLSEDDARAYVQNEIESAIGVAMFTIRPDRWAGLDFSEDEG